MWCLQTSRQKVYCPHLINFLQLFSFSSQLDSLHISCLFIGQHRVSVVKKLQFYSWGFWLIITIEWWRFLHWKPFPPLQFYVLCSIIEWKALGPSSQTFQMRKFRVVLVAASFYSFRPANRKRQRMNKWEQGHKRTHTKKDENSQRETLRLLCFVVIHFESRCKSLDLSLLSEKQDANISTLVPWQYNSIQSWGSPLQSSEGWKLPSPWQWVNTRRVCPVCFVSKHYLFLSTVHAADSSPQ